MRVCCVIPAFFPAEVYGGPIFSTYGLARGLVRAGNEVRVLTTNANGPYANLNVTTSEDVEVEPGLHVRYFDRYLTGAFSPRLALAIPEALGWADAVHLTGVYNFTTFPVLAALRVIRRPLIWSPRGGLQRWSHSRHARLKSAWEIACRLVVPARAVIHATSEQEAKHAMERMPGMDVVVLPNGIDVPASHPRTRAPSRMRLLFLGRLDPIKGLENLIDACAMLAQRGVYVDLTIAGPGSRDYVDKLAHHNRSAPIDFVGPVGERQKAELFSRSDVLILPSHSENFGMVVLEALAHGVPVVASRQTPWAALEDEGCGLWVDNDPTSLCDAIARLQSMPLEEMGARGRDWVSRAFGWDAIASRMLTTIQRLRDE